MQHDYFQKKIWFDLLTSSRGQGCVCGQNISYHVAACVVPTMLLHASLAFSEYGHSKSCSLTMTIFRKKLIFASAQPPKSTPGDRTYLIQHYIYKDNMSTQFLTCILAIITFGQHL